MILIRLTVYFQSNQHITTVGCDVNSLNLIDRNFVVIVLDRMEELHVNYGLEIDIIIEQIT